MLKELLLSLCSVSTLSTPVSSRNLVRSHTVQQDDMEITYKYETNEVNSVNDLVVGNIYHLSLDGSSPSDLISTGFVNFYWVNGEISNMVIDDFYDDDSLFPIVNNYKISFANNSISIFGFMDYTKVFETSEITAELDLVLDFKSPTLILNNISLITISNYNEIDSVERIYPDNIFGFVSEFIDEQLLNGIPNIDNVSYQIGGQTITLRSWLNTSICVVLAILLIWLLIWFVRYLFRLFSGLLH